jgi:FixJ family two-component response regulator
VDRALEKDRARQNERIKSLNVHERFESLTDKEREICRWMVKGYGNKEIAALNGSSPSTVKLHRSRVLEKMGCDALSDLLELAVDSQRRFLNIFEISQPG